MYFKNSNGNYTLSANDANNIKEYSKYTNCYPIQRKYNLSKLNTSKIKIPKVKTETIYTKLPFTIGLEFETNRGNIPWIDCLENALIPLYDGSITGHEYVTKPLVMEQAPLIHKYCELLQQYTCYDNECSLHIHFGGIDPEYNVIEKLCQTWIIFQDLLLQYIPKYSYQVEIYKKNGKDYNKPLVIRDLDTFYRKTTGNIYHDDEDFYLNNQYDQDEERKWNVAGRYYNMNIMHLISGQNHKTVEFRFLRPTYHYNEIKTYILLLGAYLNWVKNSDEDVPTIENVISFTFDENESKLIMQNLNILKLLTKIQINHRDYGGLNDYIKNTVFDYNKLNYENVSL